MQKLTIDGVPAACDALKCLTDSFRRALTDGKQPTFSKGDLKFFIETFDGLRALLDAPAAVKDNRLGTHHVLGAIHNVPGFPGVKGNHIHDLTALLNGVLGEPAAQPQGEPVAVALLRELLVGEPEAYENGFYPDLMVKGAPRMDEWLERVRAAVGE